MTEPGPAARGGEQTSAPDDAPDPNRWKALVVCLSAGFLSLLDVSIVNVALPSIETGLDASDADLQRVLTGYTLAFGLVLVAAGRAGDALRRRSVFLAGVGIFALGSALCAVAPSAELLGAARIVQGIGGGVLQPQVAGFIQQLFRGPERGRAFGFFGATIGVSTAVGPLLGGVLLAVVPGEDAWRSVFAVNLPVAAVVVVLALRYLPPGEREDGGPLRSRLDPVGTLLLAAGVVLLLLPLVQETRCGSLADRPWWLLAPGAAAVVAFVVWERRRAARGAAQVVDLALFRHRSYAIGASIAFVYFAGFTAIFFVLTLTFQSGLGYAPLLAGLAGSPFALGGFLGPLVGGRLVARAGRAVVLGGLSLSLLGITATAVVASLVDGPSLGWWTALPLFVAGFGNGLTISPNQTVTLSEVPVRQAGSAAGVLQTGQRLGSSLGIALVGTVFFSALAGSGDWTASLARGLAAIVVIVVCALALAVVDHVLTRRETRREQR